jgi:hypothetical protein
MVAALSLSQIYIQGFQPVTRYTNIILEYGLWVELGCDLLHETNGWMAKFKVVPDYKQENTNKELDGRLTSLLLLARFFSSALVASWPRAPSNRSRPLLCLHYCSFHLTFSLWVTSTLPCLTCIHDIPAKQSFGCPPMLVLCMWFDKRGWRGIPWCIMVHVWLGELDCLPLSMF